MIPNIIPIVTIWESSCLYNAISMILTGNCQLKYELRLKTVNKLISNWNVYDNEEVNLYSAWESFEKEVLEEVLFVIDAHVFSVQYNKPLRK